MKSVLIWFIALALLSNICLGSPNQGELSIAKKVLGQSPIVGADSYRYFNNIYSYAQWNITFYFCALAGLASLILRAD